MDRFVDDVEDNVESFLSHDDADPRDAVGRCMDVSKGKLFSFPLSSCCTSAIYEYNSSCSNVHICYFNSILTSSQIKFKVIFVVFS